MKLFVWLDVFRKGETIANPAIWQDSHAAAEKFGLFLLACMGAAKSYGYSLPFSEQDIYMLAGGVAVVVRYIMGIITNTNAGFLPPKPKPGTSDVQNTEHTAPEPVAAVDDSRVDARLHLGTENPIQADSGTDAAYKY